MNTIPNIRAAQLTPYIEFFEALGSPVPSMLQRNKLPARSCVTNEDYLPLLHSVGFLRQMSEREGIFDLPSVARPRAAQRLSYGDSFINSVFSAVTLKRALEAMRLTCVQENSQARVWFTSSCDSLRICYRFELPTDDNVVSILELHTFLTLVSVVRCYAGFDWQPRRAAFTSARPVSHTTMERFPETSFLSRHQSAWLECPLDLTHLSPCSLPGNAVAPLSAEQALEMDFPTALRKILHPYSREGKIDLQQAAEIANTSPRTLQRRLAACGISYSELLQQLRYESASRLLAETGLSILDIAGMTGWTDQSHFTRAFKSHAGCTPREFRKRLLQSP